MPESIIQLPADSTGKKLRTRQRVVGANTVEEQYVLVGDERVVIFQGRTNSFRIPGRAGTTGQRLAALHNATGSTVLVDIHRVWVDLAVTVVKAVTVLPPIIRMYRFTALPTGGTAITKAALDTAQTSNASLTSWQDASADGTSSAAALAVTLPAGLVLAQEFAPRLITAAGYEMADRLFFFEGQTDVTLRPLEGLAINLDYTLATQNPITDMWTIGFDWREYTLP